MERISLSSEITSPARAGQVVRVYVVTGGDCCGRATDGTTVLDHRLTRSDWHERDLVTGWNRIAHRDTRTADIDHDAWLERLERHGHVIGRADGEDLIH